MPPRPRSRRKKAAADAPAPLLAKDVRKAVKPREALKKPPRRPVEVGLLVASDAKPRVQVASDALEGARVMRRGAKAYRVKLTIRGAELGTHAFPPAVRVKKLAARRKILTDASHPEMLQGYLPDHLPLRPVPQALDRALRISPRIDATRFGRARRGENEATTVFAPDDRYTFNDTAFPWCTVGRVDTAGGVGSGVMIGPRHVLTVSHAIVWNSDGTAGWIKFTPSYFDGSEPFGVAWGDWVYFEVKVVGPGIDSEEGRHDYVVVVLDRRMGDVTGWMGSRTYSDSWDGGTYWGHIGYPDDLASATRPSFQGDIGLDGSESDPEEHQNIIHKGDVWPGQSGGPFFGWWSGEPWPRAVSVQSWQNSEENGSSGGSHMVDLVIRARNDFA
jgi:V8-like Glu-specific endopeptidase